jgi:hypothetical protein
MFGNDPERPNLTHQPKGEYEFSREDAINVMDELSLVVNNFSPLVAQILSDAWKQGVANIRDIAHAGGPDIRPHITVSVLQANGTTRNFHVPVLWDQRWIFDQYDGQGVTG